MALFANASLQRKIFLLMLVLYLPLPLLGWYGYERSYRAIKENAVDSSFQLVNQVNEHLDTYFTEVQRLMLPMLTSSLTSAFLSGEMTDAFERFNLSSQVERQLLEPAMINRDDIYGISLVTEDGIAASSSSFLSAEQRYGSYASRIRETGRFYIMGMEKDSSGGQFLAMALRFNSLQGGEDRGMLIVDLKLDEIIRITQNIRMGRSGYVWIADEERLTVYHPDPKQSELTIPEPYREAVADQRRGTFTLPTAEGAKLVVFFRSGNTGLTLFSEVLLSELNASIVKVSRMSIVVSLLLFLLVMSVASAVMYSLSHSLLTLQRLMKRAELGELGVRAPENKGAEIGSLFRSFNKMVGELKRLIEIVHVSELREKDLEVRQKEAVLHAMQAQINPHFLYNTLEFINSSAIVEGNDKISRMIVSLGDMFRYNVQNPNDIVSLTDERQHIEAYLSIQAERYESLHCEIELDPSAGRRVPAVRSMLQPIVENCFKHGFERHKLRPNVIRVTERHDDAGCTVTVADGGGGMPAGVMDAYNRLFGLPLAELIAADGAAEGQTSIGMLNVHTRLRMLFGEPYGLTIAASGADGTRIDIRLPAEWNGRTETGGKGVSMNGLPHLAG